MTPTRLFGGAFLAFVAVAVWPLGAAQAGHGHGHGHHHHGHHHHGGHGHHHGGHFHIGGFGFSLGGGHHHGYYGGYYDGYDAPYYGGYYEPRSSYYRGPVVVEGSPRMSDGGASMFSSLTSRLVSDVNLLCLDMHYNYANNPGFKETYREAYGMLESAKHLREMNDQGDREAVQRSVRELDDLFHEFRAHIAEWSREHQRQVGVGGLNTKIDMVESSVHGLMDQVGVAHSDESAPTQPTQAEGDAAANAATEPALVAPPEPESP